MSSELTESRLKRNSQSLFSRLTPDQRQTMLAIIKNNTLTSALAKVAAPLKEGGFGINTSLAALSRFKAEMALLEQAGQVESALSLNTGEGAPIEDTHLLANCAENLLLRRIIQNHVERGDHNELKTLYAALNAGSQFKPRAYGSNPSRHARGQMVDSARQSLPEATPPTP